MRCASTLRVCCSWCSISYAARINTAGAKATRPPRRFKNHTMVSTTMKNAEITWVCGLLLISVSSRMAEWSQCVSARGKIQL